ncbi:efflux transporter outer membrane subunit [Sphingobacterium sp. DK4209]|uniref:Efflux transporter outer membrane subunit n=1 Tax=Sphingobacterium zhuxiongii TaxID=2662364 RepID=A0A5Q0QBM5_9SPHI|nr:MULTISPECIES: efflux transporter outer membrane subunit [unclassified Sphingobacterium]MVZ67153.1 efflux transporter outer membrane subunit [Sphingobacterium sp. DK4209]QGA26886.1 efflux transporter outer membrane subunit [Sphingobacterium sp. dk4302]
MKKKCITRLSIVGLFLAILFIQSCKVGQKYTQPELNLPESYRGDTLAYFGDTTSISKTTWKQFFHDPTLKDLIDSALNNNFDMKTALLNIEIANKELRRNKLDYLPQVDMVIAGANKQWRSKEFGSSPSARWYERHGTKAPENMFTYLSQYGTELGFNWEIDIWGKIANSKDQLLAEYLNTREAKNAIQTQIVSNVAKGYFNLLMLDAKIEVAKRNVQLNDSTLQMIKLQYEAGEITSLAIQQTESQRLIAASLVPKLEREIIIQENALRVLTGQMPESIKRGTSFEHLFAENKDISLGSPLEIIRNRPDIRSAEFELIAANANSNIQQAMRYPALTLGGSLGVNAMLPKNWFSIPGALLGGITGELTAPIFKSKTLKTKWEIAKIEREKSELALQQSVVEAVSEVSDAVITVDKLREQLDLARLRVENSSKAVRNANLLFRSGYATYLEVITAQGNALNSDLALVELRQEHLESYVDLYRALGGGWR